jgi:FixJ family two-component response regulator
MVVTVTSFEDSTVVVVDDDEQVRQALSSLFRSLGAEVSALASASELQQYRFPDRPCCVILDVRLRGASGLDAQALLVERGNPVPVIFITGHGDIPMTVTAMKAGAEHFLAKPFREQELLDAVNAALNKDASRRARERQAAAVRARYDSLTPREREVMALVSAGCLNKQIADQLDISEITVKIHRAQVMRKMEADSLAMLVVQAQQLGICPIQL